MNKRFAFLIVLAMVLGVAVGWGCNQFLDPAAAKKAAELASLLPYIFLRLIKMIIAPLVFTTLVAGIAHMEDAAAVGRVGVKAIGWFLVASILSLLIGIGMFHLLDPAHGVVLYKFSAK